MYLVCYYCLCSWCWLGCGLGHGRPKRLMYDVYYYYYYYYYCCSCCVLRRWRRYYCTAVHIMYRPHVFQFWDFMLSGVCFVWLQMETGLGWRRLSMLRIYVNWFTRRSRWNSRFISSLLKSTMLVRILESSLLILC